MASRTAAAELYAKNYRSDSSGGPRYIPVSIRNHFNNIGTSPVTCTLPGHLNVWGNSLAAEELPAGGNLITVHGIPFDFPLVGQAAVDNVRCAGQYVPLPAGRYDWIYVLAAGERRVEDDVALHFEGGEVDFAGLWLSDFWAASAAFGERLAFRTAAMHYPRHVQPDLPGMIWLQRVPVVRYTPMLVGIRLPCNLAAHIFALTAVGAEPGGDTRRAPAPMVRQEMRS